MRVTFCIAISAVSIASSVLAAPADAPPIRTAQNNVPPAARATSLTETEAKARFAAQGFASVSELSQDDKGLWHARAIKNGRRFNLIIDAEGKVQINTGRNG